MLLPSSRERLPGNGLSKDQVRQQLERMLSHPLFKSGKRCPGMLRHIVEQALAGKGDTLKERTIGVEVFDRDPDYDTNADPVVRITAGELRKRIAQYYHEPDRDREIRIELRPGSYVPEFQLPLPVISRSQPKRRWARTAWMIAGIAAMFLLAASYWFWFAWSGHRALDRFWAPALGLPKPVLLCVGQRQFFACGMESRDRFNPDVASFGGKRVPDSPVPLLMLYYLGSQNVGLPDAGTLARIAGVLQSKGVEYQIRGESSTTLADLRNGPVVLVGAFNNEWSMRLTGAARFQFQREDPIFSVVDRERPLDRKCSVDYSKPYLQLTEDYALITRVQDPTTGRLAVLAGGLTGYGTQAAGEFLSEPSYMEAFAATAPAGWERKNVQIVIKTKVIRGNSGPPVVIDKYLW